jgi:hypothetical protein
MPKRNFKQPTQYAAHRVFADSLGVLLTAGSGLADERPAALHVTSMAGGEAG